MTVPSHPHTDHAHDFDFLIGKWDVQNRRLLSPFDGSNEWETFHASQEVRPLPGRIGNFDDFLPTGWRPGFVGMSLRAFNPATQLWSIFWLSNRDGGIDSDTGTLKPPVLGNFHGETGLFYGDEVMAGDPIKVRFEWTRLGRDAARWAQAFSRDGGQSWELNWFMDLTRSRTDRSACASAQAAKTLSKWRL